MSVSKQQMCILMMKMVSGCMALILLQYVIPFPFQEVTVSLEVMRDSVPESNGAMLILVDLDGEVAVDITVTVQTRMGTGRYSVDYTSIKMF